MPGNGPMTRRDLVRLSKFTARILRHEPHRHGLTPDARGWVALTDYLAAVNAGRGFEVLTEADIAHMVATQGGGRYEIDSGRIRAIYGHSTRDRVERTPVEPPEHLYHGTAPNSARKILAEGLRGMKRQYVHLSPDTETARRIGRRKAAEPVILRVAALRAYRAGVGFYAGNDNVWLADAVPKEFIELLTGLPRS
jgi:putative RNA 2'-phosphotransferase